MIGRMKCRAYRVIAWLAFLAPILGGCCGDTHTAGSDMATPGDMGSPCVYSDDAIFGAADAGADLRGFCLGPHTDPDLAHFP